ncbi:hypothetical protein [Streptomyces sp. NPDC052042]|uniref:hypothetical protein n=1 Tax=Streptomyces sp. NPDC052042 TaxID=3365683 RepID=UPI0037D0C271
MGGVRNVLPKESAADTEGYLVAGFAGSLLDRAFGTSDKAPAPRSTSDSRRRCLVRLRGNQGRVA